MTRLDGFWITLGVGGAIVLVITLSMWKTYRECRAYGNSRARCVAFVTHTD